MLDLIGKKLSEAEDILKDTPYHIEVVKTISDKQKEWDTMIVIRQNLSDNILTLTVSNFKLEI